MPETVSTTIFSALAGQQQTLSSSSTTSAVTTSSASISFITQTITIFTSSVSNSVSELTSSTKTSTTTTTSQAALNATLAQELIPPRPTAVVTPPQMLFINPLPTIINIALTVLPTPAAASVTPLVLNLNVQGMSTFYFPLRIEDRFFFFSRRIY